MTFPKIWFLRHGETEWNAERRIQGQLESRLTERGEDHARQQAKIIAPILETHPPCFVSPLGRAQQTAQILSDTMPFVTDPRLAEAHAGDWQGRRLDDLQQEHPDLANHNFLDLYLSAPNGERFDGFRARIETFLQHLSAPSVVVAHGLLGQVLRGVTMGLDREQMGQLSNEQGCVYVLENGTETVLTAP